MSFIATGTCTLDANQAGNGSHNAAAQVQQAVTVHTTDLHLHRPHRHRRGRQLHPDGHVVGRPHRRPHPGRHLHRVFPTSGVVTFTAGHPRHRRQPGRQRRTTTPPPRSSRPSRWARAQDRQLHLHRSGRHRRRGHLHAPTATATSGLTPTITVYASSLVHLLITAGAVSFQAAGSVCSTPTRPATPTTTPLPRCSTSFTSPRARRRSASLDRSGRHRWRGHLTPTATATSGLHRPSPSTPRLQRHLLDHRRRGLLPGAGSCVLDVNQAGNANYNAAPQVQQTVTVGKGNETVSLTCGPRLGHRRRATYPPPPPPPRVLTRPSPLTPRRAASARSPPARSPSSRNGTCLIDANQAGNAGYNAAPQFQQSISVGKTAQTITITFDGPGRRGGGWGHLHPHRHRHLGPGRHPDRRSSTAADGHHHRRRGLLHRGGQSTRFNGTYAAAPRSSRPSWWSRPPTEPPPTLTAPEPGRGRSDLPADRHRGVSGSPVTFTIDGASTGGCSISAGVVSFTAAAAASSTPTRPATPTTTPPPRCSRR